MEEGLIKAIISLDNEKLLYYTAILLIAFIVKDIIVEFAHGVIFRHTGPFNVGDKVFVDKHEAIIVNIGERYTIFEVKGYCKVKEKFVPCWRYVYNDRVKYLEIAKIVD